MTTNPESLLAVTQEDIDLVALIWSYARDDTPVDEAIQKSARQIARHRLATHPAPPAQPGREEVTPVAAYLAAKPGERLWAFALAEFVGTMKTALKPFADVADEYADDDDGRHEVWMDAGPVRAIRGSFVLDNYRKAREAFQIASDLPLGTALAAEPLLARQDWPKELDASASMPVDFERRYEVKPARADLVEQACKIIYPDLFSDDASTRHRAASPHTITHAQDTARRHIHSIAGSLATLPTEPASVREALTRVEQFVADFAKADLDEIAADGGVTVGMVFQQMAETMIAPQIRAALSTEEPKL